MNVCPFCVLYAINSCVKVLLKMSQGLGSWGEQPFAFRALGNGSNYFQGAGKQVFNFGELGEHCPNVLTRVWHFWVPGCMVVVFTWLFGK